MSTRASVPATPQRSIGLSDAAEQRWLSLTGGGVDPQADHNSTGYWLRPAPPLAQAMGMGVSRPRPMFPEDEDDLTPASAMRPAQQASIANRGDEATTRGRVGMGFSAARPTQQLLNELSRDSDAPPLPPHWQRWVGAEPFVPPEGEEWHIVSGFHVRISRADADELRARMEASESAEEDVDSEAATSYCPGSECDSEDGEDGDEPRALQD
eukprot:TRINITY_DN2509_c0_g2_i1.p1 TRINITY_DN2509_c0_g2~~TRINITY_DN2509_c0_g2_i1.p1  ORF type:complete len:211 (-),score=22.89 TRINITY_DN2509_c0_g2_i1:195-827(-)